MSLPLICYTSAPGSHSKARTCDPRINSPLLYRLSYMRISKIGGSGWIRTIETVRWRIYSPQRLAASLHSHTIFQELFALSASNRVEVVLVLRLRWVGLEPTECGSHGVDSWYCPSSSGPYRPASRCYFYTIPTSPVPYQLGYHRVYMRLIFD